MIFFPWLSVAGKKYLQQEKLATVQAKGHNTP